MTIAQGQYACGESDIVLYPVFSSIHSKQYNYQLHAALSNTLKQLLQPLPSHTPSCLGSKVEMAMYALEMPAPQTGDSLIEEETRESYEKSCNIITWLGLSIVVSFIDKALAIFSLPITLVISTGACHDWADKYDVTFPTPILGAAQMPCNTDSIDYLRAEIYAGLKSLLFTDDNPHHHGESSFTNDEYSSVATLLLGSRNEELHDLGVELAAHIFSDPHHNDAETFTTTAQSE